MSWFINQKTFFSLQTEWLRNLIFITPLLPGNKNPFSMSYLLPSEFVQIAKKWQLVLDNNYSKIFCTLFVFVGVFTCVWKEDFSHFANSWLLFSYYFIKVKLMFLNLISLLWILDCLTIIKGSQVLHNVDWSDYFF